MTPVRAKRAACKAGSDRYDWIGFVPIPCAIATRGGRLVRVNRLFSAVTGCGEPALPDGNIAGPLELPEYLHCVGRLLTGELDRTSMTVNCPRDADGSVALQLSLALESCWTEQPANLIAVAEEISDAPRPDGALRESERRFQAVEADLTNKSELLQKIFDNVPVMISFSDVGGRVRWVNREWERILGWTLSEVGHIDIIALAYPDPSYSEEVRKFLREAPPGRRDFRPRLKDGRMLDTCWGSVRLSDGSVVTIGQDVTERVRADRERERRTAQLRKARSRLQALSTQLVQLQEEERQSIARELHDEVGQLLTGLRLMIEREEGADTTSPRAEMMRVVQELIQRVRDLSMSLRPPMLDELGLLPTLLWQIGRFERQSGLQVEFRHAKLDRRFATETELTAFRIIQEGLTNVARHARVGHANVKAWADDKSLWARLEDEGQGFDVNAALAAHSSGLSGMAERARLLGGRLTIESAPGRGTRITTELPAKRRSGDRNTK